MFTNTIRASLRAVVAPSLRTASSSSASTARMLAASSSSSSASISSHSTINQYQQPSSLTQQYRSFSHGIVQHRDTPDNLASTPFKFTEENEVKLKKHLAKYPKNYSQSAVMPLLYLAQEQNNNFLTLAAMNHIAERLGVPPIRVYEVATFFTMYNRTAVGKYHVQLCGTTPCMLCGAEEIKQTIMDYCGIQDGETSADGLVTLTEVECLGACTNAPMIQVNNELFYENLTPKTMTALLDSWKSGKEGKRGPQNGQRNCEGPEGQTNLEGDELGGVCRDLTALKATIDAEAAEGKEA